MADPARRRRAVRARPHCGRGSSDSDLQRRVIAAQESHAAQIDRSGSSRQAQIGSSVLLVSGAWFGLVAINYRAVVRR